MNKLTIGLALFVLLGISANAEGYQHGWKVYEKPQVGSSYGSREINPYGKGGSKSYGQGGGRSYGEGGGRSYGKGGGKSYGKGGGKNPSNPWTVAK